MQRSIPKHKTISLFILFLFFFFNNTKNFAQTGCHQIDWETACDGTAFPEGFYVTSDAYDCIGVTITNNSTLPIVLFNSSVPTGGDTDLGTPSSNCPTCTGSCPGQSGDPNGGLTNCVDEGLTLITEENPEDTNGDGLEDVPDDHFESDYEFCFVAPVTISTLGFIDDSMGDIVFTYSDGTTSTVPLIGGLDNDVFSQIFNESDVVCMQVILTTSGALATADFCYDQTGQAPCDLVAPILGSDVSICEGDDPGPIEVLVPASGTGTIMYQWQQSIVGCVGFGDIPGATSASYNPGVLVQSTYFKVVVTTMNGSQVCVDESNCISYIEEVCTTCTNPEVIAYAIQPSCTNGVPQSDGYLQISSISVGDAYHWSLGSTFNNNGGANTYANATNISSATLPIQFANGQPNPTSLQDYTIRVFNGASDCFTDVVVTMNTQDCTVGCDCTEMIYLNDETLDLIHKFEINPTTGALTEIGNPWLDNFNNPHGLAADLNGFLYIAQQSSGIVSRIDCDGNIIELNAIANPIDGFRFRTQNYSQVDNILYVNGSAASEGILGAIDLCDGSLIGMMDSGSNTTTTAWGHYNDGEYWYLTSFNNGNIYRGLIDTSLFTNPSTNSGSLFIDAQHGSPQGITQDANGNFYVIENQFSNGSSVQIYISKYDSLGNFITSVTTSTDDGINLTNGLEGWWGSRSVVYSQTSGYLYLGARENCVAVFDTSLNQITSLNIGNPQNGRPKGIGINSECCPTNNNIVIDTVLCSGSLNTTIFLQELINCDGTICEGLWNEGTNSGLAYDPCDNSVTITALNACGSFTLESDGTSPNNKCGAFRIIVNITVASMDLKVTQTNCTDNGDNTFTANYDLEVDWTSTPCSIGEMINVSHNGASVGTINPAIDSSPSNFSVNVNADGVGNQTFSASFVTDVCSADTVIIKTPTPCPDDVPTCSSDPGCLGGNAFEDFNCNGADDTFEPGVQGIQVEIYDCNNNLVGTTYTDSDGDWQICSLTDGEAYRVEFILPETIACWATPTHAGSNNGTDIQFLMVPACTQFSVISPVDYCEANPMLAIACYENGDAASNSNEGLVSFSYNASGLPSNFTGGTGTNGTAENPVQEAMISDLGTVHGTAWQSQTQRLFMGSFLKRYSDFRFGPGYVYITQFSNGSATGTTNFNLDGVIPANGGSTIDLGTVCRGGGCENDAGNTGFASDYQLAATPSGLSIDLDGFAKVGTMSFGDVDLAEDGNTLWLVNLNQQALITVDVSAPTGSLPGAVNQYLLSDLSGFPSCGGTGTTRPWGLAFEKGVGYLGVVCDASISQNTADLEAYILSFDPNNITGGFSTVLNFDLDYNREIGQSSSSMVATNLNWKPWAFDWATLNPFTNGSDDNYMAPQPIVSDITFNEKGDMIIGFMDRFSHQNGRANYIAVSQTTITGDTNAGGDIVHACFNGISYDLEGSGGCSVNDNNISGDPFQQLLQNDGVNNNGEFYFEDYFSEDTTNTSVFTHGETFNGTLALKKGTGEVVGIAYDPIWGPPRIVNAQGVVWFDTYTGEKTDEYQVVESSDTSPQTFAKGSSLGDIQLLCSPAPLEIGNYVWCDSIENGIQDACESGIDDMIVQLYDENGLLVGQDTTVSGNYYFNQNNVDTTGITVDGSGNATPNTAWSGMDYSTKYYIVFGDSQFSNGEFTVGSDTYQGITTNDAGNNDNIDSDVDGSTLSSALGSMPAGLPVICMTTDSIGCGNHRFDMGVLCTTCSVIDSLITDRTICSGELVDTLAVITTFENPDSIAFVYFASAQTDSSLIYTGGTGIDTMQISSSSDTVSIFNVNGFTNTGTVADTFYVYGIAHPIPDDATCRPYEEILVIVNPLPVLTATDSTICEGQSVDLMGLFSSTVSGTMTYHAGNPPTNSNELGSTTVSPINTQMFYGLVVTSEGCSDTTMVTISVNQIDTTDVVASICQGDTYPFNSQNLATAGTYFDTLMQNNGCDSIIRLALTINPNPTGGITPQNETCPENNNGAATAGVIGGTAPYTYLWSTTETTQSISGLSSGVYTVTITDAAGCIDITSTTIMEPDTLQLTFVKNDETCENANGSATVTALGGTPSYNYLWEDGETVDNISAKAAGTYTVTVMDANGCSKIDSVTINNIGMDNTSSITYMGCEGDGYSITVEGSVYNEANPTGIETISNGNQFGCDSVITINLSFDETLMITSFDSMVCVGAMVDLAGLFSTTSGTITYHSATPPTGANELSSTIISNITTTQTYFATSGSGTCADTAMVTIITSSPEATLNFLTDNSGIAGDSVVCHGETAFFGGNVAFGSGSAPYTYQWTADPSSNVVISNETDLFASGVYSNLTSDSIDVDMQLVVTDDNGCTDTVAFDIQVQPQLQIDSISVFDFSGSPGDHGVCFGDSISFKTNVSPDGSYSYSWSDGSAGDSIRIAPPYNDISTPYFVTVTDSYGCAVEQFTSAKGFPEIIASVDFVPGCSAFQGDTLVFNVSGGVPTTNGYVFDISTEPLNIISFSPLKVLVNQPPGTIITTVINDEKGCGDTLNITIPVDNHLMVTMSSTIDCDGMNGSATAMPKGGMPDYTYAWSNGGTTPTISNLAMGTYTVTLTDANGCEIIDNVEVTAGSCDFDLALQKILLTPAPIAGGDDVTFEITVYNQGLVDATDVIVHDYIPTGLVLNDSTWTTVAPSVAADTIANLAAGDSAVLTITLRIHSSFMGTLINNAEIVAADGGTDSDSPLSNTNDGSTNELSTDNELDDEAPGTPGSADNPADEDDYDAALINVDCSKQVCRPHEVQVEFND